MALQQTTSQEQLMQQLVTLMQQPAALQEQTGQQLIATMEKLITLQSIILENLKKVHSHENAPNQAKCSKTGKRPGEDTLSFPEEVVEKVLARMPLPSLLNIRVLSKRWFAELPSQGVKSSLTTFQKEVTSVSSSWITYSPVFYTQEGLQGFDHNSSQWKLIFTLSYLPFKFWSFISSVGSLIFIIFSCNEDQETDDDDDEIHVGKLVVTNVPTRRWKELFIPSSVDIFFENGYDPDFAKLLPGEFDTYRVLIVYQDRPEDTDEVSTILYDSSVNEWSVTYSSDLGSIKSIKRFLFCSAYLHGKLYCICEGEARHRWKLCIHRVDSDKTWMAIPLSISSSSGIVDGGVLLCGKKIMVVIWRDGKYRELPCVPGSLVPATIPRIQIYEFDLDSLQLVNECEGPPRILEYSVASAIGRRVEFGSDEHSIYFSGRGRPGISVLTYNVQCGEWGLLPPAYCPLGSMINEKRGYDVMLESAFAPGMNPFADV